MGGGFSLHRNKKRQQVICFLLLLHPALITEMQNHSGWKRPLRSESNHEPSAAKSTTKSRPQEPQLHGF